MPKKKHGFVLVEEREIPEVRSTARLWKHERTGAELLSMINDDENKVFGVAFRTPPDDSTGVAHILEHSVLCGSEKYPIKEPFVELLKGSLQTFLNAFTYPDKTCYPVASTNLQDFHNLMGVYLDAVFFPLIGPDVLRQEGWHVDMETEDAEPSFKGVVYNEMKGVYSSPDSVLYEQTQNNIFPDNTYGLDSGGNPEFIPDLTFEQFSEFHRVNYHPGNARFLLYGDGPEDENMRRVAEYVDRFEPLGPGELKSQVEVQPKFDAPRFVTRSYAAGPATEGARRGLATVSFLMDEVLDVEASLHLHILDEALIGMPASPLRKALMDSGLGEDLTGGGLEDELRQLFFSTGLKGLAGETEEEFRQGAQAVEKLVLDTLAGLAEGGLGDDVIEAALNSVEFSLRENNTGSFPRGLHLWLRSLTAWLHGGDPFAPIAFEAPLAALKQRLAAGEKVFEELIRTRFLDNPHRITLVLVPDESLQAERDAGEKERVQKKFAERGEDAGRVLAEETTRLAELQEAEDTPEALATLPVLALSDLSPDPTYIPLEAVSLGGADVLHHDLPTDGVVYADLAFDLNGLDAGDLPIASLLGRALTEMGTQRRSFVDMGMRIAQKTGGVWPTLTTGATLKDDGAPVALLALRGKATLDKGADLFDIMGELLLETDLTDRDRLKQIVLEEKARQEQKLVPSGHQVVATRLNARRGRYGWMAEMTGGIEYLRAIRGLAERMDSDFDGVVADFERVRTALIRRGTVLGNVTVDAAGFGTVTPALTELLGSLPEGGGGFAHWESGAIAGREGLAIPAQVNYVGKGFSMADAGYKTHGSAPVIAKHLRTSFLWDRVRVRGGAYGAFSLFNQLSGAMTFASYRDPNLTRTLDTFDAAADYLRKLKLPAEELTKAIIGAVGDIDNYMLPDAKGWASMTRYLAGITDEWLKLMRDEALGTSLAHFHEFGERMGEGLEHACISVLGGRDGLEEAGDFAIETIL